jgi:hypothetical protein
VVNKQKINMNTELITAIQRIVDGDPPEHRGVPPNHIFDSHFVIDMLIKKHSDAYLQFAASFKETPVTTAQMNGLIAQQVGKCNVEPIGDAWSETIHGEPSRCVCWRRR